MIAFILLSSIVMGFNEQNERIQLLRLQHFRNKSSPYWIFPHWWLRLNRSKTFVRASSRVMGESSRLKSAAKIAVINFRHAPDTISKPLIHR